MMPTKRNAARAVALLVAMLVPAASRARSQETWRTDFSRHTVPLDEIVSGGPPKDGIPALDAPKFAGVRDADQWLEDREPVAVVTLNGETKAYPLQVLTWHEIANDEVGGIPVSVTFCPLCNTTLAFDRRFDGRILDFGTTGRLRHSDLVMYDRQTETWWQQATGEGIVGRYAGAQLAFIPAPVMSWREVKANYPGAKVLSRDTGFRREYGRNPYAGYDRRRAPIRGFFSGKVDGRLPALERVVAFEHGGEAVAVPFRALESKRVVMFEVRGEPFVVFWAPGTASALDHARVAQGRDVGAAGVFKASMDGRRLVFRPARESQFIDVETGTTWTLAGRATMGPLAGRRLEAVPHSNAFWFAWVAFRPQVRIIGR